jgi:integrase
MTKQEPLTKAQLANLRAVAVEPRDACMIAIASRHFIRASELAALKVSNVNLHDNTIRIIRLKGSLSKTEALLPGERELIQAWLAVKPEGALLFPSNRTNSPLHRSQIHNIFQRLAGAANLPRSSSASHALRHTIGQMMAEAGAPAKLIQQAAGHKSLNSTSQYFEFTQRHVDTEKSKYLGLSEIA